MASASSTIAKLRNTAWLARASLGERRIAGARPRNSRVAAIVLIAQPQALRGVRQVRVDQLDDDRRDVKLTPLATEPCGASAIRVVFRERFGPASSVGIEVVDDRPGEPSGKTKSFASRVTGP